MSRYIAWKRLHLLLRSYPFLEAVLKLQKPLVRRFLAQGGLSSL
jgi:hypothetical protein